MPDTTRPVDHLPARPSFWVFMTLVGLCLSAVGCETTKNHRCYRASCDDRPLYWHELWDD